MAFDLDFWADGLAWLGVAPDNVDKWADTFARQMDAQPFSCADDMPAFIGQVLHESSMLACVQENLSYSAPRLMAVWPRRFPNIGIANRYARKPELLANYVYGGRMGNTEPGDGWRFAGKGLIQITGRDNYRMLEHESGLPLTAEPDMLLEPEYALQASIAWWEMNVPDSVLRDVERVTRAVNGGTNGLEHRRLLTERARILLEQP